MLGLNYMQFAFPSTHDSRELLITFQPPGLFWCLISNVRVTGVDCITQSHAWPSIKTHASVGSSYLGQNQGPSGIRSMGSFQTSVLVKVSIQWGERCLAPQALWEKGSLLPCSSSRPARIGEGLLTARCVTDTQSVAPHVQPSICECVSESCTHACPWCQLCCLPTHLPASYLLFLDEAPRPS